MEVLQAIEQIGEFFGRVVVIEGYMGHECDWAKIRVGGYEDTWISNSADNETKQVRIKVLPSNSYPRPFRLNEMVRGSPGGSIVREFTEPELARFCGRLERSDSHAYAASLNDLQWCEFSFFQREHRVGKDGLRSKIAEHEFTWRFTIANDAPRPEFGVALADFIRERSKLPQERVRVSGIAIIESNITAQATGIHIITPTLVNESTPSSCARIELQPIPGNLSAIMMNVDIEDRMPDFRVFKCVIDGSYSPEQSERWVGKFHNLKEFVVFDELRFSRRPGDVSESVRGYLFFPQSLLR